MTLLASHPGRAPPQPIAASKIADSSWRPVVEATSRRRQIGGRMPFSVIFNGARSTGWQPRILHMRSALSNQFCQRSGRRQKPHPA